MKEELTKEQKQQRKIEKAQREAVAAIGRKILLQFSIRNVKTWMDVYRLTGYSDDHIAKTYTNGNVAVTIKDVKDYIASLMASCEEQIRKNNEQPQPQLSEVHESVHKELDVPTPVPSETAVVQPAITVPIEPQVDTSSDNDYGLIPSPHEKITYYYWQKKSIAESMAKIKKQLPAILELASTGAGKTLIAGGIVRRLIDMNFCEDKTWGLTKILYVAKVTLIEQIKDDFKLLGINCPQDVDVINIEQLRCRAGELYINRKQVIVNGQEETIWEWKKMIHPVVIIWDECQGLKNEDSTQSKIAVSFSDLPNVLQIFMSATPFGRVCEARTFALATRMDISHVTGIPGTCLSANTWPAFARYISGSQSDPTEYNEAAVERLRKALDEYIIQVRGMKWQFNAKNHVEIIDFEAPAEDNDFTDTYEEYKKAWLKYLEMMEKLKLAVTDNPQLQKMIQLGIFLAAAEYSKRYIFARRIAKNVKDGYAAFLGVKFKKTIIGVTKILVEKYGFTRDQIALIWGGGQTQLTAKQKLKIKMRENQELLAQAGITLEDMDLDQVEDRVMEDLPKHLRLGTQTKEQRQLEIRRYQSGKALVAIYTFKAGGVGLSLPHTDRYTSYKCRRKPNGYVYPEDVINVPTRPRKGDIGPTWSPIELIQGCGRTARVVSLSDTDQALLYYRGTVEEDQALVVMHRLKCHGKVVRQQESWLDLIVHHGKSKELAKEYVDDYKKSEVAGEGGEEMDMELVGAEEDEE